MDAINAIGIKKTTYYRTPEQRRLGWLHYKQLRAIFKSLRGGVSMLQACKAASVNFTTLWRWRKNNERLNTLIINEVEGRICVAEDKLFDNVLSGKETSIFFFLCNRAPERWHNIADVKNILIAQMNAKKEEELSPDKFKEIPRVVFSAIKKEDHA